jgi:peptidoglycan/xylan/chitin deacetylase (PgdA/CDA1 family)
MVKNFLFHRVNPSRDVLWDPMDVSLFDHCVRHISANYNVVLLEDMVLKQAEYPTGEKKYATIVFDDGYKDNLEYALPILEKYKVKASFYAVTDCIEKNIPTWTHQLDYAFQFTKIDKIDMIFDFLPPGLQVTRLNTKQERIAYVRKLKPAIKKITHVQRQQVMNAVLNAYYDINFPFLMMNWDDLRQIRNGGHYVGSHTVTHCMLGTINDEQKVKTELVESGNKIRKELGYFPLTISYPVGSYNETTIRLSKEAGYKIGLAVRQKVYDPLKDSLFEIPRIELYNESWLKTRLRISDIKGKLSKILNKA